MADARIAAIEAAGDSQVPLMPLVLLLLLLLLLLLPPALLLLLLQPALILAPVALAGAGVSRPAELACSGAPRPEALRRKSSYGEGLTFTLPDCAGRSLDGMRAVLSAVWVKPGTCLSLRVLCCKAVDGRNGLGGGDACGSDGDGVVLGVGSHL